MSNIKNAKDVCEICSSNKVGKWRSKKIDGTIYVIKRCQSCGFAFVDPKPSHFFLTHYYSSLSACEIELSYDEILSQLLSDENDDPNSTIDARRIINNINKMIIVAGRNKTFLDVGCGVGFYSNEARENGYLVKSIELSAHDSKIASLYLGETVEKVSFEKFESNLFFSVVLMSHILEHSSDVNGWIEKASSFMEDGSILVISVPNFSSIMRRILNEKDHFICPPEHLNYFSLYNLRVLLNNHGFDVNKYEYISEFQRNILYQNLVG